MESISFKTKNEAVYETLRKEILEGMLKPGAKIIISNLTSKFGLSETPIREAVRRLESEGLLIVTPHVGTTVSKIDPNEIIEFYLIRTELEALATKLATPLISTADLENLLAIIGEMEDAIRQNNFQDLGSLNEKFHLGIYRSAPYPHLLKLIVELWEKVHRIRSMDAVFVMAPSRANESLREHKEIIEAIKQKDADRAAQLVRKQKQNSLKAIAGFFGKDAQCPNLG